MDKSYTSEYVRSLSLEIRNERKNQNMSIKAAADKVGMLNSNYFHLEKKEHKNPSFFRYLTIFKVLHVKPSNFLKRVHFNLNNREEISITQEHFFDYEPEELLKKMFLEIRRERKRKKQTQEAFSKKIDVGRSYLAKVETGKHIRLSLTKFLEIAAALEVPLYVLVERAEQSLIENEEEKENEEKEEVKEN